MHQESGGEEKVTASGKTHMQRVANWASTSGCACCGAPYDHLHHMLEDRTPGRKSDDWLTMPLCLECHTGRDGIHGTRLRWSLRKMSESKALAKTLAGVYG